MPLAVQVVLQDHTDNCFAATAMSLLSPCMCHAVAPTKREALDRIEFNLVMLGVPFTLHVRDECHRTPLRIIIEAFNGIVVATAFDEDGVYLCDGACCCANGALDLCMRRLPRPGRYDVTIDVLNPNEDESDADCW